MPNEMPLCFDRRVPPNFVTPFQTGCLAPSTALAGSDRWVWDVHFRRKAWSTLSRGECSLTIYAGMTSVLTIVRNRNGWSARTHRTYSGAARTGWSDDWSTARPLVDFCEFVPGLVDFVRDATDVARESGQFTDTEGLVHAAFANGVDHGRAHIDGLRIVDREANVGFRSKPESQLWMQNINQRLGGALQETGRDEPWWPPKLPRGTGCDFLCTDGSVLYAVEAKPATAGSGIVSGPLQVRAYAELFAAWIRSEPGHAAIIEATVHQRHRIGFGGPAPQVAVSLPAVPVLLVGPGAVSEETHRRALLVASSIASVASPGVEPLQWWRVDPAGRVSIWQ
ncbi:MAG: hypothetical protein LC118_06790 [Dehalococcoidia bacterium]|nr:hypothetical protein [Dehalococcoidia bacterium]